MPGPPANRPDAPDARAVAEAFGLGAPSDPATPAARGELGRIWRLGTRTGLWAVKELFEPMSEAEAKLDVAFQLAALRAGVPLPEPRLRRDGGVLAEVTAATRDAVTVRVYAWVDFPQPPVHADAEEAAAILARMHQLAWPAEGPADPWYTEHVGAERWQALLKTSEAARPPWLEDLRAAVPELLAAEQLLSQRPPRTGPFQCCHLDFNPYNVLTDVRGQAVVIDWENSGGAAIDQELAMALMDFMSNDHEAGGFLDAYRRAGGPAVLAGAESFASAIAVQGYLIERYGLGAVASHATPESRHRSARWIVEMLGALITLPRIERVLASLPSRGLPWRTERDAR